jgi:hypothetical protein
MSITYVSAASANANTVNLPTFQVGDIAIVFAAKTTSMTVQPTLPSGWTTLYADFSTGAYAFRLGYRVLQTGDTTTGVWTNADKVGVVVYRGQHKSAPFDLDLVNGCRVTYDGGTYTVVLNPINAPYSTTKAIALCLAAGIASNAENLTGTGYTNRTAGLDGYLGVADGPTPSVSTTHTLDGTAYRLGAVFGLREASDFPIIVDQDTTSGTVTSNSSSWTLTYPTNIAAGDLLLALVSADGAVGYGTFDGTWSQVTGGVSSANVLSVRGKVASGTESGTFTITINNGATSEQGAWIIYRIPAGTWYGDISNGCVGQDGAEFQTGLNPDPPSLDPGPWATENTLWLAAAGLDTSRTVTDFTNWNRQWLLNQISLVSGGSNGATLVAARRDFAPVAYGNSTLTCGQTNGTMRLAQSFIAQGPITSASIWPYKSGSPTDNLIWEIQTDSGSNEPSGTVLTTFATIAGTSLTTSAVETKWSGSLNLTASTKYWIVLRRSTSSDASNYYLSYGIVSGGSGIPYADGNLASYSTTTSTWTQLTTSDLSFSLTPPIPVASFDPELITISASDDWAAATIGIRPKQILSRYAQAQVSIASGGATTYRSYAQSQAQVTNSKIYIKKTYLASTDAVSTTINIPIDAVTEGNILVLSYWGDLEGTNEPTITGSGKTWIAASSQYRVGDSSARVYVTTGVTDASSATQVTASWSSSSIDYHFQIWEIVNGHFSGYSTGGTFTAIDNYPSIVNPISDYGAKYRRLYIGAVGANVGAATFTVDTTGQFLGPQNAAYGGAVGIYSYEPSLDSSDEADDNLVVTYGEWSFSGVDTPTGTYLASAVIRLDQNPVRRISQAQTSIAVGGATTYRSYAQGQAQIKTTYSYYAQSQARIKQIYLGYAQAQTHIKISGINAHAQGQAQIKKAYQGFAQGQADIKQTYRSYAQAQVAIKQTYRGFAQAQSQIRNTYQGYAQAQVKIATTRIYAQAQTQIKQTYKAVAQSNTYIRGRGIFVAQSNAQIKNTYQVYAQSQAQIKTTYREYAQAQGLIKTTYRGYAQSQAAIKQSYLSYAQSQTSIKQTYQSFAQANAAVIQTTQVYAQSQGTIKAVSSAWAQTNTTIKARTSVYAQASVWIKQTYPNGTASSVLFYDTFTDTNLTFLANHTPDIGTGWYSPYDAWIGTKIYGGQAYAAYYGFNEEDMSYDTSSRTINSFDNFILEAQNIPTGYGTCSLNVRVDTNSNNYYYVRDGVLYRKINSVTITSIATVGGSGNWYRIQVSGINPTSIKVERRTTQGALGTGWLVETTDNTTENQMSPAYAGFTTGTYIDYDDLGNTFGYIDEFKVSSIDGGINGPTFAQAQAKIKATSIQYAQSQARIKASYQGYAQSQAQILGAVSTVQVFAQSQAQILATSVVVAQASVWIKQTYPVDATYYPSIMSSNPIAYWRLNDSSSSVANEITGFPQAYTYNTPTLQVEGLITGDTNKAIQFDKESAESIFINAMPVGPSNGITLETWIRFDNLTNAITSTIVRWGQQSNTVGFHWLYYLHNTTGILSLQFSDGTAYRLPSITWTATTNTIYHLVVTHDYSAKQTSYYIDGKLIQTYNGSAWGTPLPVANNQVLYLANYNTTSTYALDGTLDEVAFYDRPLTENEIVEHFNVGKTHTSGPTFAQAQVLIGTTLFPSDRSGLEGLGEDRPLSTIISTPSTSTYGSWTFNGPITNGLNVIENWGSEYIDGEGPGFRTDRLKATTLSGSATVCLVMYENDINANATPRVKLERLDSNGNYISTVFDSILSTWELPITPTRFSWRVGLSTTVLDEGDRLRLVALIDDAAGSTMAYGYHVYFSLTNDRTSTAYITLPQQITVLGYEVSAQAQVSILQIYQTYAQTQASILVPTNTYTTYAQAQASLKVTGNVTFGQAQARVKATSRAFAQASVWIKQTYPFGAGPVVIASDTFTEPVNTPIVNHTPDSGGPWTIRYVFPLSTSSFEVEAASDLLIIAGDYYLSDDYGNRTATAVIEELGDGYIQGYLGSGGYFNPGLIIRQPSGDTDTYYIVVGGILYRSTNNIWTGLGNTGGASGDWYRIQATGTSPTYLKIERRTTENALGTGWHLETTDSTSANQTAIGGAGVYAHDEYDNWDNTWWNCGSIDSITVVQSGGGVEGPTFAQAQARIKTTYRSFAQSQARIKATYQAYAQAQARIRQTYIQSAQSQAQIKQTYTNFAQAQTRILVTYTVVAQSNALIRQTYTAYAQSQTHIKVLGTIQHAQSQTAIKQTYTVVAQSNTWIKKTANNVYAQSGARIKVTYQVYAQASAAIKSTYRGYAQANASIALSGLMGYAQAQVQIRTIENNYAQALAYIYIPVIAYPISDVSNNGWVRVVI